MRNWERCYSVGKAISIMALDTGSCSQQTLCIFSLWLTPFPWCYLTFYSSNELLLFRLLTRQIAVWLGFGFAWRASSERECSGYSDICATVVSQIVDFHFDIWVSWVGLGSLFNEVHLREMDSVLCAENPKAQGALPPKQKVPGEGTSYSIDDLQLALQEESLLPFPRLHYVCLHSKMLESFPIWNFAPFNSQVLQFFNFSLFSPCLLCFPHCFLSPGRNTVGRDWYTRDIFAAGI